MALTPPKRHVSDTENKLRLLCCVEALSPITEVQLWPFVADLELMDYISMQLLLHELMAAGDVEVGVRALEGQLYLGAQGKHTLQLFAGRVMASDRERIAREAPAYRARLLQHRQVRALYEEARPGSYHVLLSLEEGDVPTLHIRLSTPSRTVASFAIEHFKGQAAGMLAYLYTLAVDTQKSPFLPEGTKGGGVDNLTSIDREATPTPLPVITQHGPKECTVTAHLRQGQESLQLSLLLPDPHMGEIYWRALATPEVASGCARVLLGMLQPPPTESDGD